MDTVYEFDPGPAADVAGPLLACCQKALGHDLPNQFVAVQGLAGVLLADRATASTRTDARCGAAGGLARRPARHAGLVRPWQSSLACAGMCEAGPVSLADWPRRRRRRRRRCCARGQLEYRFPGRLAHLLVPSRRAS